MIRLLTAEQMKRCDSYTIKNIGVPSRTLMQRAAQAAFDEIKTAGFDLTKVVCLCGTGNNGGDGFALAMIMREAGIDVTCILCGEVSRMTEECRFRYDALAEAGIPCLTEPELSDFTFAVDAILGIGLAGDVRGAAANAIDALNDSGIPVVALDIPSGINSDTGAVMGRAVMATLTVSFARLKPGHVLYPGREHCGRTDVADIGIGEEGIADSTPRIFAAEDYDIAGMLPQRHPHSHKGTYGRLLVAAGCEGMCGAAYLSALGAYRSGAGIVEVYTPRANVPVLQGLLPEAITTGYDDGTALLRERMSAASACVVGPGLGRNIGAVRTVESALGGKLPLVIDADGLNIIAADEDLKDMLRGRNAPTVVTPHPAEMSRLYGGSVGEICADPVKYATDFAKDYGVCCVLKGSVTAVAQGDEVYLNLTGCSGLAKGGSGDVLSGVIGAFIASGQSAFSAAVAGVWLHGRAGEIASAKQSEYSLLASDIANNIGQAILSVMG